MYGKVDLVVRSPVPCGTVFTANVSVSGAKPGGEVTVALQQMRGIDPMYQRTAKVAWVDPQGNAATSFEVRLAGPSLAILLASAYDDFGPHFAPDAEVIEVSP